MALKKHSTPSEIQKLILHIERDLLAQSRFKTMLIAAGATLKAHRQELRVAKALVARRRPRTPRRRPKR